MKKVSISLVLTLVCLLVCFLLLDGQFLFGSVSAQDERGLQTKKLNDNLQTDREFGSDQASADAPTLPGRVREYNFTDLSAVFSASDVSSGVVASSQVSVSGRVLTNDGRAVSRARMTLTTNTGDVFEVTTNFFGYYRFGSIPSGSDYVFTVADKHYDFSPRIVSVRGDLEGFDFISLGKSR